MTHEPDVASIAALIGDPTRANILANLLGGIALPATELAHRAHVTPQTISGHLTKLREGGLVTVRRSGRHRYYMLKSPEIAQMLETLQTIAPLPETPIHTSNVPAQLRYARTCYDHLAGKLGVAVTEAWVQQEYLIDTGEAFILSNKGEMLLASWDIDVQALRKKRRKFAYPCLDWSERRYHLAGAVGASVVKHFLNVDWVRRRKDSRALLVTGHGTVALYDQFNITLPVEESQGTL
ncbi:MAG: helix-turn-helix transcriptional regulator [Chloroflexota bacterium]